MKIQTSLPFFLLIVLSFFAVKATNAQVTVDNTTMTVEQLVNEILLGEGVEAYNITYNGMPGDEVVIGVGSFNAVGSNFPIGEGVVMGTSNVQYVVGGAVMPQPALSGDPDLLVLAGQSVFNNSIIEFDFTVESDSVIFDYIFASNEYNSFTCDIYNDVFGFFLSGPDSLGPFTNNAKNIALIPGTDVPVGINSLNSGSPSGNNSPARCLAANPDFVEHSQYFINNNAIPNSISNALNGHSVVLTARSPIVCGGEYHIKLAIANASDPGFQSAVFLRKGSFSAAGEVFLTVQPSLPGVNLEGTGFEDVVVAGCFSPLVELARPEGAPVGLITATYGGTAIEGVDFELGENDTLFAFSEGVDTLRFNITTFPNPNAADTIFLEFYINYETCLGVETITASIPIVQPYSISSSTENVTVICPADTTVVTAQGLNGVPPYNYNWVGHTLGNPIPVPVPPDEEWFVVLITDQCEFEIIRDSVLVVNNIPPPLSLSIPSIDEPLCPRTPLLITALVADGNGSYSYNWSPVPSNDNVVEVSFPESEMVYLTVTDSCATQVRDSVFISYPVYENMALALNIDKRVCPESPLRFEVTATGGAGGYSYLWTIDEGDGRIEDPAASVTLVSPDPGLFASNIQVIDQCFQEGLVGLYIGLLEAKDTLRTIDLSKVPNVITPNRDGANDFFAVPGLEMFPGTNFQVWNRWGISVFESNDYTVGTLEGFNSKAFAPDDLEDGSYFYILNVNSGDCVKTEYLQILGSNPVTRR